MSWLKVWSDYFASGDILHLLLSDKFAIPGVFLEMNATKASAQAMNDHSCTFDILLSIRSAK